MRIRVIPNQAPITDQCAVAPLTPITVPNTSKIYTTSISAAPGSGTMVPKPVYTTGEPVYIDRADQTSIITNTPK